MYCKYCLLTSNFSCLCENGQINEAEANYMRDKYRALYEINIKKQSRDLILTKKIRGLQNDLLNEKMVLEKARMDEADELNRLQNIENERDDMQKVIQTHFLLLIVTMIHR